MSSANSNSAAAPAPIMPQPHSHAYNSSSSHSSTANRDRDRERERERERDRDRERERQPKRERSDRSDRSRDRDRHHRSRSRSRSPSFDRRRRERKSRHASGWDNPEPSKIAPPLPTNLNAATVGASANPGLSSSQHLFPSSSVAPVIAGSVVPQLNPNLSHVERQARRLYVGNLPTPLTDTELRRFFTQVYTQFILNNHSPATDPIISVFLNAEKKYGFVEFRRTEDATKGMALDGVVFNGLPIKVKRPDDYLPPANPEPTPKSLFASANPVAQSANSSFSTGSSGNPVVGNQVPDGPNKIFMGGLPYHLSNQEIKDFLQQNFGPLSSFHLVTDSQTKNSKGFCFYQFIDPNQTDEAIRRLNGYRMGEKLLTVKRSQANSKAAAATMGMPALPNSLLVNGMAGFGQMQQQPMMPQQQQQIMGMPQYQQQQQVMDPNQQFAQPPLQQQFMPFNQQYQPQPIPQQQYAMQQPVIQQQIYQQPQPPIPSQYPIQQPQYQPQQQTPQFAPAPIPQYSQIPQQPQQQTIPQQPIPTPVLVLSNMVTPEELLDNQEYLDIIEDIRGELQNYGPIVSIVIPRPLNNNLSLPVPGLGKVFIQYSDAQSANRARNEVEGRPFANRSVHTEYMQIERFMRKEF